MSLLHGLYNDLKNNQNDDEFNETSVDRPKGIEPRYFGKAPDCSIGQLGQQGFATQMKTRNSFDYWGENTEKYTDVVQPKLQCSKPLTLWLYCNSKDREKIFQEMSLLVENFEKYYFLDPDTVTLQCFNIGFSHREIYYLVLKRFPKLIHKMNIEYHFLGSEVIKMKTTINEENIDKINKIANCVEIYGKLL